MAPFATPPHDHDDDPSAAGDRTRLHRWARRGRPAVPLLTDAAGRVHAVTHHVDQLLRQPTAAMAPYRATARRWLDQHMT